MNESKFTREKSFQILKKVSNQVLDEIKENSARSKLIIGTSIGFFVAYPTIKIARAIGMISGGTILALAVRSKGNCCFDLSDYSQVDLTKIVEFVRDRGSLSVGFVAGFLIGFAYS